MNKRTIGILILVGVIFVILIGLTVYLVQQQQDVRSHAATADQTFTASNAVTTPTTAATTNPAAATAATPTTAACTIPASVTNVQIAYPYQDTSNNVFYAEANCTWSALTGVDSYAVKVTNSDTSAVVSTQTVSSSSTNLVFPVVQGSKYKCEVSGTNSCGTGPAGSAEVTCQVDGIQPSASTSGAIIPTATPVLAVATPTSAPPPSSLPSTGSTGTMMTIGIIGTLLVVTGGALLFGL